MLSQKRLIEAIPASLLIIELHRSMFQGLFLCVYLNDIDFLKYMWQFVSKLGNVCIFFYGLKAGVA